MRKEEKQTLEELVEGVEMHSQRLENMEKTGRNSSRT